jgi:hypothetical protein
VDKVVEKILADLKTARLTIVSTYLSDEMFAKQQNIRSDLEFTTANKLYCAALAAHSSLSDPPLEPKPEPGFW